MHVFLDMARQHAVTLQVRWAPAAEQNLLCSRKATIQVAQVAGYQVLSIFEGAGLMYAAFNPTD